MVEILKIHMLKVNEIKPDLTNPNKMSSEKLSALKEAIKKYGFIVPIITNKDFVIADGFHRWTVAVQLGMQEIPAIVLDVTEVNRRMLRQVMNKLRGEHDFTMDVEEYDIILKESGSFQDFSKLMGESEEFFKQALESRKEELEQYLVIRQVDKEAAKNFDAKVSQLKLKLTEEQISRIKERFEGREDKIYEIIDYFLVIE